MIPDRFDALVGSRIHARSRRSVLGLVMGGLAALGSAEALLVDAKNKRKQREKLKKRKKICKRQGRIFCRKRCCQPGEICAQGKCVTGQGTCEVGDSFCAETGEPFCFDASGEHTCICQTRLEGGPRCGTFPADVGSSCGDCETDDDCVALGLPPGTSCIDASPGTCICPEDARGVCFLPCGIELT